jgi:hypothetical protein
LGSGIRKLDAADVALAAERIGERPASAGELAEVREVLAVGRKLDREGLRRIEAALLAIELPVRDATAVLLVEELERGVLSAERRRVLGRLDHVLGVLGDEGAAVLGLEDGVHDDLLRLEVVQVDDGQPRIRLVVDEQILPVVVPVRLGDGRVVRVTPGDFASVDAALVEDRLRLVVEPVGLPGLGVEDGDVLEDAHRRHAVDDHHPALPARAERDELVAAAGGRIGLHRRQQVLLGESPLLHHLLKRLGSARTRGPAAKRRRKKEPHRTPCARV